MKHVMLDAYGVEETQSNNIIHINELLNEIAFELELEPICPPQLIPYYYGKVKEDVGITSFMMLRGGHITIHTFPIRECYFVDCVSEKDFDTDQFYSLFYDKLHFSKEKSIYQVTDRNLKELKGEEYDPSMDFGPHYMAKIKREEVPTMESVFDFLENVVDEIGMDEITRAFVLKDTITNPTYLSGIIIIAQSHISIHYSFKKNVIYADCFSCAPFDFTTLNDAFSQFGEIMESKLIARGTKHLYKAKSKIENDTLMASTRWQKIVKREE